MNTQQGAPNNHMCDYGTGTEVLCKVSNILDFLCNLHTPFIQLEFRMGDGVMDSGLDPVAF